MVGIGIKTNFSFKGNFFWFSQDFRWLQRCCYFETGIFC